jgi:hypothetical protein
MSSFDEPVAKSKKDDLLSHSRDTTQGLNTNAWPGAEEMKMKSILVLEEDAEGGEFLSKMLRRNDFAYSWSNTKPLPSLPWVPAVPLIWCLQVPPIGTEPIF